MRNLIDRFVREDAGQDVIEYALLAAFVSIIAASIISSIGLDLTTIFNAVKAQTGAAASSTYTSEHAPKGDVIVKNLITRFIREDAGQDVIEYALLAAFVSIIAASIINTIGPDLTNIFTKVKAQTAAAS